MSNPLPEDRTPAYYEDRAFEISEREDALADYEFENEGEGR